MKKLIKQSLSLALALLMVLSLVPAMPLVANAEDFTPGASWTIASGYESLIQGSFTPDGDDFIYEADEAFNWKTFIKTSQNVSGLQSKAMLTYNGQTATKTASGINVTKGTPLQLWTPASFTEITAEMYGNFSLTVEVYHSSNVIATGVLNFVRNAPAPVVTEPVETTAPAETDPVETTAPVETEPTEFVPGAKWDIVDGYTDKIRGAFTPDGEDFVYEADEALNWKSAIQAGVKAPNVNVVGTLTYNGLSIEKRVTNQTIAAGGTLQLFTAASFPEIKADMYGNFQLVIQVYMGTSTLVATGTLRFTRNEPENTDFIHPGIAAKWVKDGYDWAGIKLSTHDHDYVYYGNDAYDWNFTANVPTDYAEGVFADKESATLYVKTIIAKDGVAGTAIDKKAVTVTKGESSVLVDASLFSQLKDENGKYVEGDFTLIVKVYTQVVDDAPQNVVAQYKFMFSRKAQMNKVGYRWDYTRISEEKDYSWLNGKFITKDDDGKYGAGQSYDWYATINPSSATALNGYAVYVEAEIRDLVNKIDGAYPILDTYADYREINAENRSVIKYSDFANFDKTAAGTYLLDTKVYAVPVDEAGNKIESEKVLAARLYVIFSRTDEIGAYPGGASWEYAGATQANLGNDFVNADPDNNLIYVGDQSFDWRVIVSPPANATTFAVRAQVIGNTGFKSSVIEKKVDAGKAPSVTTILSPYDFKELTSDIYGTFELTCNIYNSTGKTLYATLTARFSRIPGEAPNGTVSPFTIVYQDVTTEEFITYDSFESCDQPGHLIAINNTDSVQTITGTVSLSGSTTTIGVKMQEVQPGEHVILAPSNALATLPRDTQYTVYFHGYWGERMHIGESFAFNRLSHTKVVVAGSGIPATCTTPGLTDAYECPGCGWDWDIDQVEIPVDPEAHTFIDGTCSCGATETPEALNFISSTTAALNNSVALQFVIDPDLNDDGVWELVGSDNYVVINKLNRETNEWEFFSNVPQSEWGAYTNGRYVASCDLAAMQMTDQFKVVLYNNNGEQISHEWIDSGRAYGMRAVNTLIGQVSNANKKKQLTMFVDFLNYCAAAQIQFNYYPDDLANSMLTDAQKAYATVSVAPENMRNGDGKSQVNVEARIELSFLFDPNVVTRDMYGVITYTHFNGEQESITIQGKDFATYKGQWSLLAPNIATPDGNQLITCVIYDVNGNEVAKAQDSVDSYMARVLAAPSASASLKALATAAVKLTTSSYNFFNK